MCLLIGLYYILALVMSQGKTAAYSGICICVCLFLAISVAMICCPCSSFACIPILEHLIGQKSVQCRMSHQNILVCSFPFYMGISAKSDTEYTRKQKKPCNSNFDYKDSLNAQYVIFAAQGCKTTTLS